MKYNLVYVDGCQCEFLAGVDEDNECILTEDREEAEVFSGTVDDAIEHCKREGEDFFYMGVKE